MVPRGRNLECGRLEWEEGNVGDVGGKKLSTVNGIEERGLAEGGLALGCGVAAIVAGLGTADEVGVRICLVWLCSEAVSAGLNESEDRRD